MAYRLIWSPTARLDLRDLLTYIAEDDPAAARAFARSLFRTIERLPRFPESGRIVPEFNEPTIREVIRKPCRIVYRIKAEDHLIEIARVWHAARGLVDL
jgi:plasmid stabilization system protein ParE